MLVRSRGHLLPILGGTPSGPLRAVIPAKPLVAAAGRSAMVVVGRRPGSSKHATWVFGPDGSLEHRFEVDELTRSAQVDQVGDLWLALGAQGDRHAHDHPHAPAVTPAVARYTLDGVLRSTASVAPLSAWNALAVSGDGVWSSSAGGGLIHLPPRGGIELRPIGVHGVRAIASDGRRALLVIDLRPVRALLVELTPRSASIVAQLTVFGAAGEPLEAQHAAGRGCHLHLACQGRWHRLEVQS